MIDLRKQFWSEIYKLAKKDKNVIVLTGDLGFSFCESFQKDFPEQFINCGCAENNMVGVAVGLAIAGKKPYVYSNSLFLLSRANEFIRDDLCYNAVDVKLIGTGASGFLGFSHNTIPGEDINLLDSFPNIEMSFPTEKKMLRRFLLKKGARYIKI